MVSPDQSSGRDKAAGVQALRGWRGAVCALAIAALLGPSSGGLVRAEDSGVREFLLSEGAAARPTARPAPAPVVFARPMAVASRGLPRAVPRVKTRLASPAPAARARPASPRSAYVSLPRAPVRAATPARESSQKQTRPAPRAASLDAVTALLHDSTLRPGDIAMFPDGPKVFKGGQVPFKRSAFEDVRRSGLVSGGTRKALAALGTAPAKPAALSDQTTPSTTSAGSNRAEVASIRVVYPVR